MNPSKKFLMNNNRFIWVQDKERESLEMLQFSDHINKDLIEPFLVCDEDCNPGMAVHLIETDHGHVIAAFFTNCKGHLLSMEEANFVIEGLDEMLNSNISEMIWFGHGQTLPSGCIITYLRAISDEMVKPHMETMKAGEFFLFP